MFVWKEACCNVTLTLRSYHTRHIVTCSDSKVLSTAAQPCVKDVSVPTTKRDAGCFWIPCDEVNITRGCDHSGALNPARRSTTDK